MRFADTDVDEFPVRRTFVTTDVGGMTEWVSVIGEPDHGRAMPGVNGAQPSVVLRVKGGDHEKHFPQTGRPRSPGGFRSGVRRWALDDPCQGSPDAGRGSGCPSRAEPCLDFGALDMARIFLRLGFRELGTPADAEIRMGSRSLDPKTRCSDLGSRSLERVSPSYRIRGIELDRTPSVSVRSGGIRFAVHW